MTTTVQIQMNTGMARNGTVGLPGGASYEMTNGIVSVNAVDVPAAIRCGWQVMAGQNLAPPAQQPQRQEMTHVR